MEDISDTRKLIEDTKDLESSKLIFLLENFETLLMKKLKLSFGPSTQKILEFLW